MIEKYDQIKIKCILIKNWILSHPKLVYSYMMTVLLVSFAFPFIQYFCFTPKIQTGFSVPKLYSESDQVKAKLDKNEQEIENVVKELQRYKSKRENGPLTKNDSLRIEYLFKQYQNLKNGH